MIMPTKKKEIPASIEIPTFESRTIAMKDIAKGLGVEPGDLVEINNQIIMCQSNYDYVTFPDKRYSSNIPNLILGAISGKYGYTIYKVSQKINVSQDGAFTYEVRNG